MTASYPPVLVVKVLSGVFVKKLFWQKKLGFKLICILNFNIYVLSWENRKPGNSLFLLFLYKK